MSASPAAPPAPPHLPPPQHIQVSSSTEKHWRRRRSFISIYRCSQAAAGKDISPHPRSTTHAFKNLPGLSLSHVIASVTWPPLRAVPPHPPDLMGCEAARGGLQGGRGTLYRLLFWVRFVESLFIAGQVGLNPDKQDAEFISNSDQILDIEAQRFSTCILLNSSKAALNECHQSSCFLLISYQLRMST